MAQGLAAGRGTAVTLGLAGCMGPAGRISACQQPLSTHLSACCSPGLCRDPKSLFLLNPGCSGQSGPALGPTHPQFLLGQQSCPHPEAGGDPGAWP